MSNEETKIESEPQEHLTLEQRTEEINTVATKLREISENILDIQRKEQNELPLALVDDSKPKPQPSIVNKPFTILHETENHVNRLLEKLLQERNRVLEAQEKEAAADKDTEETNDIPDDQENLDPKKEVKTQAGSTNSHRNRISPRVIYESDATTSGSEKLHAVVNQEISVPEVHTSEEVGTEEEPQEHEEVDYEDNLGENLQGWGEQYKITDFLYVSKSFIDYGTTLPGQILEESLEILNKSDENIIVQIFVDCLNSELASCDEYIFAIRRSHSTDYNDKHYLIMSPYSSATFKLALKVPSLKLKEIIRGETTFSVQGLPEKITLRMETKSVIPKVISLKELHDTALKCNVIKLAVKNTKKLEVKFPIKNCSNMTLGLEMEIYKPREYDFRERFDCYCLPSTVNLNPNGLGLVNIVLKPSVYSMMEKGTKGNSELVKKVIIAKCKDSSVMYSFVVLIEVFD